MEHPRVICVFFQKLAHLLKLLGPPWLIQNWSSSTFWVFFSNIKSSKVGHVTMDLMFTILPRSQEHPGKIIGLKSHRYPRIRVTWGTPPRLSITKTWVPSLLLGHVFFFFFGRWCEQCSKSSVGEWLVRLFFPPAGDSHYPFNGNSNCS